MTTLNAGDKTFSLECATADDVADIVALLVDDPLGQTRETAPLERYLAAFADIDRDPNQTLLVLRDDTGAVPGTVQDRKNTRLNSSHVSISYAVFCLKKKKEQYEELIDYNQLATYVKQ